MDKFLKLILLVPFRYFHAVTEICKISHVVGFGVHVLSLSDRAHLNNSTSTLLSFLSAPSCISETQETATPSPQGPETPQQSLLRGLHQKPLVLTKSFGKDLESVLSSSYGRVVVDYFLGTPLVYLGRTGFINYKLYLIVSDQQPSF